MRIIEKINRVQRHREKHLCDKDIVVFLLYMSDQGRFLSTLAADLEMVHHVMVLNSVPPVSVYATLGVLGGEILH